MMNFDKKKPYYSLFEILFQRFLSYLPQIVFVMLYLVSYNKCFIVAIGRKSGCLFMIMHSLHYNLHFFFQV